MLPERTKSGYAFLGRFTAADGAAFLAGVSRCTAARNLFGLRRDKGYPARSGFDIIHSSTRGTALAGTGNK